VFKPHRFNFFGLSVGAIIPDLEVPILFLLTGETWEARSIMHSILGAVTVDLILALLLIILVIPPFLKFFDKRLKNKRLFFFGNIDLRNHKTSYGILVYSILIGTISHVLIDTLHHYYNPLTFPFQQYYDFNLLLFNNLDWSNIIMQGSCAVLLIFMGYIWYLRDLDK
jgi:hypothetical protein